MKQVKIVTSTNKAFGGTFESETEMQQWISSNVLNNIWGLPERPELIENENGEMVETGVILPAEYQIIVEDITAQVEEEKALQDAQAEIAKGIKGIATFKVQVKKKGLNQSQIAQLFSNPEINKIIGTLSTGSIPLAIALINAYQADGVIVTEEDKAAVIAALG